jgi:hypothetical protein
MEQWILDQEKKRSKGFASEIDELDKEADRLADRLEEHMKNKRKRDFEIRLLKASSRNGKHILRACLLGPLQRNVGSREKGTQKKHGKTPRMT